jgi:hypothetical protein
MNTKKRKNIKKQVKRNGAKRKKEKAQVVKEALLVKSS